MNELPPLGLVVCLQGGNGVGHSNAFHGHDAVGAVWQRCAGHDLDALAALKLELFVTGDLRCLNREISTAAFQVAECNGDAVHHYAVEWWLVTLGDNGLVK